MEFEVFPLFSCPVALFDLSESFDEILNSVEQDNAWLQNESELVKNNFISKDLNLLDNFLSYKNTLLKYINFYVEGILADKGLNLKITTSWLTKTTQGGFSRDHAHYNSFLSGVYYFDGDSNESDGELIIQSPQKATSFFISNPEELTLLNSNEWRFTPVKGRLIIFPSYLVHRIGVHNSDKPRHSLAFNTYPVGDIGALDSSVNIYDVSASC